MFCPKCGNSLSDTAMFCSNCGHKFEKSGKKQIMSPKKKKIVISALVCLCVLILVYFSLVHILQSKWNYVVINGKAHICGYNGNESEIVIPKNT